MTAEQPAIAKREQTNLQDSISAAVYAAIRGEDCVWTEEEGLIEAFRLQEADTVDSTHRRRSATHGCSKALRKLVSTLFPEKEGGEVPKATVSEITTRLKDLSESFDPKEKFQIRERKALSAVREILNGTLSPEKLFHPRLHPLDKMVVPDEASKAEEEKKEGKEETSQKIASAVKRSVVLALEDMSGLEEINTGDLAERFARATIRKRAAASRRLAAEGAMANLLAQISEYSTLLTVGHAKQSSYNDRILILEADSKISKSNISQRDFSIGHLNKKAPSAWKRKVVVPYMGEEIILPTSYGHSSLLERLTQEKLPDSALVSRAEFEALVNDTVVLGKSEKMLVSALPFLCNFVQQGFTLTYLGLDEDEGHVWLAQKSYTPLFHQILLATYLYNLSREWECLPKSHGETVVTALFARLLPVLIKGPAEEKCEVAKQMRASIVDALETAKVTGKPHAFRMSDFDDMLELTGWPETWWRLASMYDQFSQCNVGNLAKEIVSRQKQRISKSADARRVTKQVTKTKSVVAKTTQTKSVVRKGGSQ